MEVSEDFIMEEVNGMGDAIAMFSSNDIKTDCDTLTIRAALLILIQCESVVLEVVCTMIDSYNTFKNKKSFPLMVLAVTGFC